MGAAYSDQGGLPLWHLDAIAAGEPVQTRWDPMPYSPIHDDDICAQLEPLLDAASVPATIVNWVRRRAGERAGVVARTSASSSASRPRWWWRRSRARRSARSATTRSAASITGPCRVGWREGSAGWRSTSTRTGSRTRMTRLTACRHRYPSRDDAARRRDGSDRSLRLRSRRLPRGLDVLLESLERDADLEPGDRRRRDRRPPAAPRQPARGRGVVPRPSRDRGAPGARARSTSTACRAPARPRSPT